MLTHENFDNLKKNPIISVFAMETIKLFFKYEIKDLFTKIVNQNNVRTQNLELLVSPNDTLKYLLDLLERKTNLCMQAH